MTPSPYTGAFFFATLALVGVVADEETKGFSLFPTP